MNENKRLLIMFAVIAVIIIIGLLIAFWPTKDNTFACNVKADGNYEKLGKVNYKQYQCLYKTNQKNALVVSNKMTDKKKESLNKAAKKVSHAVYYLDTESLSNEELQNVKKELKYSDKSFTKDVIIIIKNNKIVDFKENILDNEEDIYNYLKESKIAKFTCDVQSDKDYKNIGEVDYDEYQCLYESEEAFAIILSQTTCSYCKAFKPVINEYVGKNNLPIYKIEINELSESDRNALTSSLSYFDDNDSWGTPLTLGIKNKKVVANISGYTEDEGTISKFFEDLGLK